MASGLLELLARSRIRRIRADPEQAAIRIQTIYRGKLQRRRLREQVETGEFDPAVAAAALTLREVDEGDEEGDEDALE